MSHQTTQRKFDWIFLILLLIIVIGTPLVFTSLTRSVFEINKLLLLRLTTITALIAWLFNYLQRRDNGQDNAKEDSYTILGFRWKKVGLEIPILIWLATNLLSTIFSQNIRLSLVGAYDRWEGIFTVINYGILIYLFAKLVKHKWQLFWILGAILASTGLSSIYGICQSLGMDFMKWSVDPTQRVFACINNPVHFCAYVAMVVPLGFGLILYLTKIKSESKFKPNYTWLKWVLFIVTGLIYYNQFLSYSRATWMGFIAALTFFYFMLNDLYDLSSKQRLIIDFTLTAVALGAFYIWTIFHYTEKSLLIGAVISVILCGYLAYQIWRSELSIPHAAISIGFSLLLYFNFLFSLPTDIWWLKGIYHLVLSAALCLMVLRLPSSTHNLVSKLILILIFTKLQFCAISWTSILLFSVAIGLFILLTYRDKIMADTEYRFWQYSFLILFGAIVIIPSLPTHFGNLLKSQDKGTTVLDTVVQKVNSYENVAIEGTARTSMWKSSLPWIKDYPILGSGLDTIKYIYPKYRLPDYGILEGGHNFTPDRLHNEYLNTLASKGIIGFLAYYVGVIGLWFGLILSAYYRLKNHPNRFLLAGVMAGTMIYLGQVLFNFGVVATLVLFYILMGLGIAIAKFDETK